MATTSETTTVETKRGFSVACPRCLERECVRVNLEDLDAFVCTSCDEEFSGADVRALVAEWQRVLAWLGSAPKLPE